MSLDWLILVIALISGLFSRLGMLVAIWIVVNQSLYGMIDLSSGWTYWQTMTAWAILFSLKDFALMPLARNSLTIVYALAASCVFHQVVLMQILTYTWEKVTLFEYRSDIMLYLSVIMLATVIKSAIGGGSDGGRRVINWSTNTNHRLYGILYAASQKVIK